MVTDLIHQFNYRQHFNQAHPGCQERLMGITQ
jgi:hypothetical protein